MSCPRAERRHYGGPQRADDFEIVSAESVGIREPRWWCKAGEKISLKWFARKRVLYHESIRWPRPTDHDQAVVYRRVKRT